jgi:hypothetical protein
MHQALLNKARRGDLCMLPPVGYIKRLTGEFSLDPDEQAQGVIRLIFDEFDRLTVHYSGLAKLPRYVCGGDRDDGVAPACQCLSGRVLDQLVGEKILQALEPAALELSLLTADDLHQQRQRLDQNWQQRLERAHYQAERAQRHYRNVEPENRLVARELARQWEEALKE